jgi:hypothetical protein
MLNHTALKRSLTICLALGAAACPAAAGARVIVPGDASVPGSTTPAGHARTSPRPLSAAPAATPGATDDFQWDDAGIGAAVTVTLIGAGGVATIGVRRRQTRRGALS